jgi:hypothetical protein
MNRLFSGVWLLVFGVVSLGLICPASAATSGPYTTSTPIPMTTTDWSGTLAFPEFNSSLGTLTEVDLSLTGGLQTTLTVTNDAASASSGTATTEVEMTIQDAGTDLAAPGPTLYSPGFGYSLGPGDNATSGLLTQSGTATNAYTSGVVLAEFNGPGTILLNASTFTQTLLANTGGNTAASQVTAADLTGTVTYQYTPTPAPEPSTLVLLGIAGVGLVGYLWRRRQV